MAKRKAKINKKKKMKVLAKRGYPILKEKKCCYFCDKTLNLTYHHIIPKKEIVFNGYENIMILCRKCHNIVDVSKKARTSECYQKHKIMIDEYNKYLKENEFGEDLLWKVYAEVKKEKKEKKRSKHYINLNKERVHLNEYIEFKKKGKLDKLIYNKKKHNI